CCPIWRVIRQLARHSCAGEVIRSDRQFICACVACFFFFFNDPAPTQIYTLSLHDALPISRSSRSIPLLSPCLALVSGSLDAHARSEEHTSELQSRSDLVCRLLLEKKK